MVQVDAKAEKALGFPLASHFSDPVQQLEAGKLGMWLFLATEVLFFGGLFTAYAVFHNMHPEVFKDAHHFLVRTLGALNTIVLLTSSLTVVLGIHAAQKNKNGWVVFNILATLLCACAFLVVKYFEYSHKIHLGLLPGYFFTNATIPNPDQAHVFFSIYFMMTGLHGIHVLIGILIFIWLFVRAILGHFHAGYYAPLEIACFFCNLFVFIWLFLFPLLYLIS